MVATVAFERLRLAFFFLRNGELRIIVNGLARRFDGDRQCGGLHPCKALRPRSPPQVEGALIILDL